MPERDWQQTHEKIRRRELRKRILVMGLTVAMVANTVDLSALSVSAKTDESETGKTTIVSFEELSKDITEQTLPIGALESDIKFPTSLTVTVEKTTQADEKEADDEEDASETGDTEKDDAQKDDSNGDTASSDDKKDTESSDEKDGDSGNADASDKSGASDNGNADTKDSDTSKDSGNSDKSNNPNGSSSSDTEDTQARADLPSAFGALIGQMADTLLPHKLIVHAAEKDDASDTASTSDVADNAKKTDTASISDNADSVKTTGSSDAAASSDTETTTEKIRLKNIKWELNVEESDAEEFDSSEVSNCFCSAYTPVLPDEDGDGNQLVLGKDVELPTIYVLVGEYGIALLADGTIEVTEMKADGTVQQKYNAQDLATWIGGHGSASLEKVSIKLLNDDASITSALTIGTGLAKEIELDLNGHTLTLQGDNARLYFKRANITITSSGSNKGTITGSYQSGKDRFKGDGLITVDRVLKIEHVTIKNAGTGSTVAMWEGATCTIDEANISGSNGSQEGVITICDSNACTITHTEVTGNVASGYGAIMFMDSCSDCTIGDGAVIKNENSGGYCVKVNGNYNVKITVEKGATLTADAGKGTIMNTSYGKVAVDIENGTFNGRLGLPDNSQITGGTFVPASGCAIEANGSNKTLQDLLKVGYTLQYGDGTYANLTAKYTDKKKKVTAVKSPLYFMTHPTIASGAETVMENYTAAEAPELTVKAVSGSGSISYQWYADETINGTTKNKVEQTKGDATSATYKIPTGLLAGTYQYYCVATCGEYTATSQKAAFTVEEGVAEVTVGGNTTRYATLTKAFDAVKATVNAADADADLEITLKILKNISETGSEWKIDEGTKKVSFCMDLNGCTVTGKGLYITGEGVEAVFKDTSAGQNGTLSAQISIQNKAKLTVENGNYTKNLRFSSGATGELKGGYYSQSIYIGNANSDNTGISCTITGGEYKGSEVCVYGGAALSVSGADTKIDTLQIDHSKKLRAEVTLSGGEYKIIILVAFPGSNDDLLDEEQRYAIADTLAEGYAFYSAGIKTDISRTEKTLNNVKVLPADTPEDVSLAVVKFQIEKNDGKTNTKYFLTWDAAMSCLEATESNLNNLQEYTTWKKLEILLLKDAEATRGYALANIAYLPAEITLRSEGNEPHTLTGRVNSLFKTGEQDVTIENINVVGNINFLGNTKGTQAQDAAVLRLGEGVAGLKNVKVSSGKAEIVIEKGAKIPDTFAGDESNLNASIYCNHDSAGDIASRIEQGASAFKVWFPIELGGITLPTDGENVTNITQRDGATYGLYSNGGTTDQKIKVTGEVCSYEPYGGNAVTIKTTDLSFTMPSSKVTLKAHTKDDYGYCDSCQKTDLAEAYKNGHLHIEGLVGRTYDSYPQVMTGVTLDTANGNKSLTGPSYKSGRELAQDSTDPANADISKANYYVVYANNIDCYRNEEGGSDFKADEAPKVTITGQGSYYGTIEHYFTIGYGEVVGEGFSGYQGTYDGKAHGAVQYGTVRLKADAVDSQTMIPVADGLIVPCTGKTMETDGFASNFTYYFVLMYYENGVSQAYKQINDPVTENHMITNAGNYTIYVSIHEARKNMCASLPIGVKATIEPRSLTDSVIHLDDIGITVYYTGMPIIPENWDRGITDSNRKNEPGNDQGVLDKDKDFTVSAENNTEVTNGKRDGKITFTGIGNYKGELVRYFDIAHAFTLAQTTVSKNCWYNEDSNWWKNGIPATFTENDVTSDNPVSDWKNIVYRTAKGKYAIVSDEVVFYASLEDAVAGKNPGYTFKEEGTHTVTLYGKDPWNQSIVPVEITINIDTTAPTWADADGKEDGYGIQIKDNWWRTLLNKISFGHLYNDTTLDIKIHANDAKEGVNKVSGVSKYYYYIDQITDTASATGKTKAELDTLAADGKFTQVDAGNWLSDSATIHGALGEDGSYVVYAYAMDNAGNQSDYICTEGLVQDASAPVVTVTEPKKEDGTLKDTEAILKVNLSEDATLMWFIVSEGVFDGVTDYTYDDCKRDIENYMKGEPKYPQFAVENDGKWAPRNGWNFKPDENLYCGQWEVRTDGLKYSNANQNFVASWTPTIFKTTGTKGDNKIEIGNFGKPDVYFPLYPSKKTAVWIAAIDKAGNITALTEPAIEFTTTKAMPKVTTLPEVSGVYGNKTADLKITKAGVARYGDDTITGTWTVQTGDTHIWQMNDTGKCLVTFTPDTSYGDTYEAAVVEVTPTIAPRPITIKVADMHKVYGKPCPGIDDLAFEIDGGTPLAADDTRDTIKQDLVIEIPESASKLDSTCGKYHITFKLENKNYKVTWKYYKDLTDSDTVDYCQLVIEKAAGEIKKLLGFKATQNVQYQHEGEFATSNLGVEAGHKEAALQYAITDAKKANGAAITDAAEIANKLLSISADGKVTLKGAGSAKITISLPESTNYTAAEPLTVKVNIEQAYFKPPKIYRDFLFLRGGSDSIDLAALLPKDCGEITYGAVKTSDSKSILEGVSVSQDGKLSYTVKAGGTVGNEATITVPVSTENYNINTNQGILVVIKLIAQLPVQPKGSISLKTDTLTYGEALSSLQFNSAAFTDKVSGKTVPGKLSFDEPDKKPDAGDYNAAWTFTPADDAYAKCKGMITVSVKKAVPKVVSVPIPEAYYYSPTGIMADWCQSHAQKPGEVRGADGAMLDGIWRFKEASLVPKPGTSAYPVIFTPTDTKNYETIEKTVTLTVKKAMPYISTQPATANAYTHGDYLYNQTLTGAAAYGNGMGSAGTGTGAAASVAGTFKWKAPSTKLTHLGNKTFEYLFTPEDTASYEAVTGSVTVTVNQAQDAPFMPGSKMNVAKFCETVGSVKLPQGWKWNDADAAKALVEDNVTSATAVYDGADKGSYKAETVTIQITRASCEHAKKEVKGAVKATCIAEGTTGETRCLVCGKKLDDGVATPKDTANHTNLVSRQLRPATTTQEGIMSYACSGCGYYAEKAIEKLVPGGSSSTGSSNSSGSSSGHHSGSTGSNSGRKDSTAAQSANLAPAPTPAPTPMPVPAPAPAQPANPIRSQGNAAAEQGKQAMPFIRGEDGKEGWEVIKAETAARAEGERVTVDMNGASVVPGDVFDEIRGKNVTIEFDLGGGISWSVNGKSVSDKVGDIDFRVMYGEEASDAIPVDLINALTGERTSMNVTLAYEGRFGFEAVLRINVGAANQGLVANLFYYNESTRELEFISAGEVDAEGFAYLSFTHASDYTIVLDEASMEEAALTDTTGAAGSDGAESAETASEDSVKDNSATESRAAFIWLIAFAGIAAAAAIGAVAVKKRKEEKQTK